MNKRNRMVILIAAALATAGLGMAVALPVHAQGLDSPSTTPAQGANRSVDVQGDGQQQALDQAITKRVREALQLDSELKTQTILIDTVDGNVRLTGQVTSASNFDRAKAMVGPIDGVKNVENLLVVKAIRPI